MKEKTVKAGAQAGERHYYKVPVDSATGKLITRFWHACQKCEAAAEDYCKKFGAKYYYSDPKYFAGGVACVAFDLEDKVNHKEWSLVGKLEGDNYYLPACESKRDMVEIPSREYSLKDSWDTMYLRDQITETPVTDENGQKVKKLMIPRLTFRPTGQQYTSGNRPIQAGRALRRAIIAEQKRMKLPVMSVQQLYRILEADLPQGKLSDMTPTFFLRSTTYYIGCDYSCWAKGLEEITQQIYRMNNDLAQRESNNAGN